MFRFITSCNILPENPVLLFHIQDMSDSNLTICCHLLPLSPIVEDINNKCHCCAIVINVLQMHLPVNPPPLWFEFSVFLFPTSGKILMLDIYMYRCILGSLKQIFPFLLELVHLVLLISGDMAIRQMTITCVRSSPPTIPLMNLCFSARAATQATSSGQLLRLFDS